MQARIAGGARNSVGCESPESVIDESIEAFEYAYAA